MLPAELRPTLHNGGRRYTPKFARLNFVKPATVNTALTAQFMAGDLTK